MATSTESVLKPVEEVEVPPPPGVNVSLSNKLLTVKGPKGTVSRDFSKIPVGIELRDGRVVLSTYRKKKVDRAILNTCRSHVQNMYTGVTKGFVYKLKVVFAHFPITVKVQNGEVRLENFYGERSPRVAKIVGEGTQVKVEGDDIIVSGPALEGVAQTAANIENSTKVKRKDQRVFLDGVYIYQRKGVEG